LDQLMTGLSIIGFRVCWLMPSVLPGE